MPRPPDAQLIEPDAARGFFAHWQRSADQPPISRIVAEAAAILDEPLDFASHQSDSMTDSSGRAPAGSAPDRRD